MPQAADNFGTFVSLHLNKSLELCLKLPVGLPQWEVGECVGGHSEQGWKKCVVKKAPRHKTDGKSEGTENRVKKRGDIQKPRKKNRKNVKVRVARAGLEVSGLHQRVVTMRPVGKWTFIPRCTTDNLGLRHLQFRVGFTASAPENKGGYLDTSVAGPRFGQSVMACTYAS